MPKAKFTKKEKAILTQTSALKFIEFLNNGTKICNKFAMLIEKILLGKCEYANIFPIWLIASF